VNREGKTVTEIKICGITNPEDALFAAACGADALGFIFYRKTPRFIVPERAKEIIAMLPADVVRIGVFVNHGFDEIEKIRTLCALDMVQLHGDESPEFCRRFSPSEVIKAFSPRTEEDLSAIEAYPQTAVLVDARTPGLYGGTGATADWDLAGLVMKMRPLILAGGLNPENIGQAMASVSPAAVDINSGVETAPGKKDHRRIREIIDLIRSAGKAPGTGNEKIFRRSARR
jgi:phosphoribosylanthranilate isomerase